jgi:hypothetical protein
MTPRAPRRRERLLVSGLGEVSWNPRRSTEPPHPRIDGREAAAIELRAVADLMTQEALETKRDAVDFGPRLSDQATGAAGALQDWSRRLRNRAKHLMAGGKPGRAGQPGRKRAYRQPHMSSVPGHLVDELLAETFTAKARAWGMAEMAKAVADDQP